MTSYSGLFLRNQLGDVPTNPKSAGWSGSPDIILAGTAPTPDPSIYTTPAGYSTDYGSTLYINQTNYTYVRALNATGGAFAGRLWFYYTQSDLALWPQNWLATGVWNGGQPQNWAEVAASAANQVVVGPPMQWVPPPLGGSSGNHYCLICMAENDLAIPPVDPKPTSAMGSWQDLANFVISHPNMGWRNTVDVSNAGVSWSYTAPITGPTGDSGSSSQVNVGYQCSNMPTDGTVSISMKGPPGQGDINLINQPIQSPNQSWTVQYVKWPNNFNTQMTVSFHQGNTTPQKYSGIVPVLTSPSSKALDKLAEAHRYPFHMMMEHDLETGVAKGPVKVYIIGGVPLMY